MVILIDISIRRDWVDIQVMANSMVLVEGLFLTDEATTLTAGKKSLQTVRMVYQDSQHMPLSESKVTLLIIMQIRARRIYVISNQCAELEQTILVKVRKETKICYC